MLRIVTGSFHPDLEDALVDEVLRIKSEDSLAPLTIVVPSEPLRRRLKWLVTAEKNLALLDVRFFTFYQFALLLLNEAAEKDRTTNPVTLRPEFFFKELVHHLLRVHLSSRSEWAGLVEMPGAWAALWATLKDLKDAGVQADLDIEPILEAAGQCGFTVERGEPGGLGRLLTLYRALRIESTRLGVGDYEDLVVPAKDLVPSSEFLGRQRRLLYYGFYDLTQVQLDLFQAVARAHPATLYFPLVKGHPSFLFAQRFFERYILGMAGLEFDFNDKSSDEATLASGKNGWSCCRIVNVSGMVDEVTVVAKEILGLVEERGYAFFEIGVVARTLSGYESVLPRVFEEQGVPFTSTMGRSLASFPFVKAAVRLLELGVSGFLRDHVMDLLSSPFTRITSFRPSGSFKHLGPRLDQWEIAGLRLGVMKGVGDWRRLEAFRDEGLPLDDDEEGQGTGPRIPAEQIRWLWNAVSTLDQALKAFPEAASWSHYVTEAEVVFDRFLDPHAGKTMEAEHDVTDRVVEQFRNSLDQLRALSPIVEAVSLAEFCSAFRRLMEETAIPFGTLDGRGVQVLDGMAARGLPFRAMFILGLNEKVFPRHIHEDAFLRDRLRRFFEADLGFKIPEKVAGYDEEKLLFALLCRSAREELVLLYQRTDEAGRFLVPSSYLEDVKRELGSPAELTVPRRLTAKFERSPQYRSERLIPSELAVKLLFERRIPRLVLERGYPAGVLVEQGLRTLPLLENGAAPLGPFDGITGSLETWWSKRKERGFSPTSLEIYAGCPFRYFAGKVLQLDTLMMPEDVDPIGPREQGILSHAILRTCFQTLSDQGYFSGSADQSIDPLSVLDRAACHEFERFSRFHPTGFPLVWELHQERLLQFLRLVFRDDLRELAEGGWEPVLFEEAMAGTLPVNVSEETEHVPVLGRLDRVDWSASRKAYRIVDYKFKASGSPDPLDVNLALGAVRGRRLQPPLYLVMAPADGLRRLVPHGDMAGLNCEGVWFFYLAPSWERGDDRVMTRASFPGDAWTSDLKPSLDRTLREVLTGIRTGRFFIYPGSSCDQCDYRQICRKTHQPTLWRSREDRSTVGPLQELRRTRLSETHVGPARSGLRKQGSSESKKPPDESSRRRGRKC